MKFVLHEFHTHTAPIAKWTLVGAKSPRPMSKSCRSGRVYETRHLQAPAVRKVQTSL